MEIWLHQNTPANALDLKYFSLEGSFQCPGKETYPKKTKQGFVLFLGSGDFIYFRMFIWRSILRLPENHAAYAALVDKGTHPAFEKINDEYPIKSRRLLRILQR